MKTYVLVYMGAIYKWINEKSGLDNKSARQEALVAKTRWFPLSDVGRRIYTGFWRWELCVRKLQGEVQSSNSIKNQEFPFKTIWDFWKKMDLEESQNFKGRCQQIDRKNKLWRCDHCVMKRISHHHGDDQEALEGKKSDSHKDCGKDFMKKSSQYNPPRRAYLWWEWQMLPPWL